MAAGFSVEKKKITVLEDFLNSSYNKIVKSSNNKSFFYLSKLSLSGLNKSFNNEINKLYPFGTGNPEPIFLFENLKIKKVKIIDNKHISNLFYSKNGHSISSISFNSVNETIGKYLINYKNEIGVIGFIKENFWNNKKILQLVVRDLII